MTTAREPFSAFSGTNSKRSIHSSGIDAEELGVDPERPEIDVWQPEAVGELAGARLLGGGVEEPRDRGFGGGGSGRAHAYPLLRPVRP